MLFYHLPFIPMCCKLFVMYVVLWCGREVVGLLLKMQASANIPDLRGCFPLHLAAWRGNADICRVLLRQGPSLANVNAQVKQESLADAKVSARQQCVYEDPYRRNLQQICNWCLLVTVAALLTVCELRDIFGCRDGKSPFSPTILWL